MTPKYELNRPKKGIVYCVNNVDREFPNTKQDVNLIQSTLGELGFEVESARLNLRQHELEFLISKIRETDFSKFNIFILFVLSHGWSGDVIACIDSSSLGLHYSVNEIIDKVSENKSLRGFPKLFFFDSCRGGTTENVGTRDTPKTLGKLLVDFTPASADIFTGFATARGFTASSHSPFIRILMENFKKRHKREHLSDIYQSVIFEVTQSPAYNHIQNLEMRSTLRKKLFISEKKKASESQLDNVFKDSFQEIKNIIYPEDNPSKILSYKGTMIAGKPSGKGTMVWRNGAKYVGSWLNGARHGEGVQHFASDSAAHKYVGTWKVNKFDGKGTLLKRDGSKYVEQDYYSGEWKLGKKNGKGKYVWRDGNVYDGDWVDSKMHGSGVYTYKKGSSCKSYEGSWKDGKKSGKGTLIWTNGAKYVGAFENDTQSGWGVMTVENSRERYDGPWKDGKRHGEANQVYSDGSKYVGNFKNDQRNGKGLYYYAPGSSCISYEGDFVKSSMTGDGITIYSNGDKYKGKFKAGVPDGFGIYYFHDHPSHRYEGQWVKGKMQGKGTSYFADGSKYDGHFENEQYQGFGIFTFPNLSSVVRYEGEWEEGKKHGFGSTFNRDGSSYVGQNGKKSGQGTLLWKNREKYTGAFSDGNFHGKGTHYAANGDVVRKGWFENGKFKGP